MGLEDLDGMLDVIIFSDVYQRCKVASDSTKILIVEGLVEFDQVKVEPFIRAENIYAV
jgi:hypothetical protein